jgi:hypothetical protein
VPTRFERPTSWQQVGVTKNSLVFFAPTSWQQVGVSFLLGWYLSACHVFFVASYCSFSILEMTNKRPTICQLVVALSF